jgi:hypothetical protein
MIESLKKTSVLTKINSQNMVLTARKVIKDCFLSFENIFMRSTEISLNTVSVVVSYDQTLDHFVVE